uniref:Uncharacterized protein n=1 Tax=Parascaris equorum TaxID=6256 RepID=A0A914RF19_PAREQ
MKMDAQVAARIVALRPCIEAFIVRSCLHPESADSISDQDKKLIGILEEISSPTEWKPLICEWEALDDKGSASPVVEQCRERATSDGDVSDTMPTHPVHNITRPDLYAERLCDARGKLFFWNSD